MKPKYQHDCDQCKFLGQFYGFDVYTCVGSDPSIIARFSSDGPDYYSTSVSTFKKHVTENILIGGKDQDGEWQMTFAEYLFSHKCSNYHKAWLTALAVN
jgi:hypothetical protein